MTNKLTKNDRLKSRSDKHDVAVATFEALLNKSGAHRAYFYYWDLKIGCKGSADVFYAWKEWARMKDPTVWLQSAFIWRDTDNGFRFWYSLHITWIWNYREIINK